MDRDFLWNKGLNHLIGKTGEDTEKNRTVPFLAFLNFQTLLISSSHGLLGI